jgi:hypothetical protein
VATASHKNPIFDFGSLGSGCGQFDNARGIAINETGNGGVSQGTIYVVDQNNNRIQSFDANGGFLRAWGWDVDSSNLSTGFEIATASCKAGSPGGGAGQFSGIHGGIAVDQATGNVSVIDRDNIRIQQFTATGTFLRAWGGDVVASGPGDHPEDKFEICVPADGDTCKAGVIGSGPGMFAALGIPGIGVDSTGNVYFADNFNKRVQKFAANGSFLRMAGWDVVETGPGNDTTPPVNEFEICVPADGDTCKAGVGGNGEMQFANEERCCPNFLATAAAGDVFVVGRSDGTIYHLASSLTPLEEYPATAGIGVEKNTRNPLAVNSADGRVLFAKVEASDIFELDPSSGLLVHEYPAGGDDWVGLAMNGPSGRFYGTRTPEATSVRVFDEGVAPPHATIDPPEFTSWTRATLKGTVDPEGTALTKCELKYGISGPDQVVACAETPAEIGDGSDPVPVHVDVSGLSANGAQYNFHRLSAANADAPDESDNLPFETPEVVVTEPATVVGGTTAVLNGTVNPLGQTISECKFEYGTSTAYGQSAPCAETAVEIGTGNSPVPVHADVTDLAPGTQYHFRLVAANPLDGSVQAEDEDLQTLGPAILATWSEDVELTEAVLKAEIDPEGKATSFHFEYGTSGPCSANSCVSVPVPDGTVGSDSVVREVSALLKGLAPGTIYHYRVVATNADAVNEGPDRIFYTYRSPVLDSDCPNQALRIGPSASLPDCRAYEMVSPVDKNGGDIVVARSNENNIEAAWRQASTDGERVTYTSKTAFGDAKRGSLASQYLSRRNPAAGWSTSGLNPPLSGAGGAGELGYVLGSNFRAFSEDLCLALLRDQNVPPLLEDALEGTTNFYVRHNCESHAGSYTTLTRGLAFPAGTDLGLFYGVFSRQDEHVVFGAAAPLLTTTGPLPAPGAHDQIYDYDLSTEELHLISVLPDGEAASVVAAVGTVPNARFSPLESAVSEDASRVFFMTDGQIYVRINRAETVQISSGVGAQFVTAAADGSTAIYELGGSLFEFDVDSEQTSFVAGEVGGVVGSSKDLSHLYFTSKEALDDDPNSEGDVAQAGEYNVYLRRNGEYIFVATVDPEDGPAAEHGAHIDSRFPFFHASRVTPDGRYLAFMSIRRLTGYDNTDAVSGEALSEVFRYDAEAGELLCASCRPSAARPRGRLLAPLYGNTGGGFPHVSAAAWLPTFEWGINGKRPLSDDGNRIFFNAYDALALRDVNGAQDVYQWEAAGTGGCGEGDADYFAQNGGCLSLISSGRNPKDSEFLDASVDGSDVFFTTADPLDERDPGNIDVYDARVLGGFPPPPPPPPPCVGDACQVVPAAPDAKEPASLTYSGPGNSAGEGSKRCRKGERSVRRKGKARCVRKSGRGRGRHNRRAGR